MSTKLTLLQRKEIKQYEPKIDDEINKIKENFGLESLSFEPDYLRIYNAAEAKERPDLEIGYIVHAYLEALNNNTSKFKGDEMVLEAVHDAIGGKTAKLVLQPIEGDFYARTVFGEGEIKFELGESNFSVNLDRIGEDIEEKL
jgi:hypothetical protein